MVLNPKITIMSFYSCIGDILCIEKLLTNEFGRIPSSCAWSLYFEVVLHIAEFWKVCHCWTDWRTTVIANAWFSNRPFSNDKKDSVVVRNLYKYPQLHTQEYRESRSTLYPCYADTRNFYVQQLHRLPIKPAVGSCLFIQEHSTWLPVPFRTGHADPATQFEQNSRNVFYLPKAKGPAWLNKTLNISKNFQTFLLSLKGKRPALQNSNGIN